MRRFRAAWVQDVAIERGDGPVVEVLLDAGLPVFVVPSRRIKSLRSRYGSAGNEGDQLEVYVLADTLRTDGHRWRALREDSDDTRALRALCRRRSSTDAAGPPVKSCGSRSSLGSNGPTYHRRQRQARLGRLTPIEYETIMTTTQALAA